MKKIPLFLGINADSMTGSHVLTFAMDVKQEARDMIAHFESYLAYKYVPETYSCMQKEAGGSAKQAPWDPESHTAKTKEDELMRNMVAIVDGMDWLKSQERMNSEINNIPCMRTVGFQFDNYTLSVKTINSCPTWKRKNDTDGSDTSLSTTISDDGTSTFWTVCLQTTNQSIGKKSKPTTECRRIRTQIHCYN